MKVIANIALCGIFAGLLFLTSCGENSASNNLSDQNKLIQSYITTNELQTKVLPDGDLRYQYIRKGAGPQVKEGSKVSINYALYVVSTPSYLKPYTTNVRSLAVEYKLDTAFTSFESLTVTIGSSGLFKGFERGLTFMQEGDSALLLFPSTLGYGDVAMGVVPANSPLAIRVSVNEVK